ncbi:MAG: Slp family lipoprotein [Pseudomonadota bacterium]
MNIFTKLSLFAFSLFLTTSCSVIPKEVKEEAQGPMPFEVLAKNANPYIGKVFILGGYILEVRNLAEKTELVVLQAPLSFQDEPGSKDESRGRFIIFHVAFLDPEIYKKNRKITVAGTITGSRVERIENHDFTYPTMDAVEIYLWPRFERYRYPYYYDYPYHRYHDPFDNDPHFWDPFYRRPHF